MLFMKDNLPLRPLVWYQLPGYILFTSLIYISLFIAYFKLYLLTPFALCYYLYRSHISLFNIFVLFISSWFVLIFFIIPFYIHSHHYYRIKYRRYWENNGSAIGYLPRSKPNFSQYLGSNPNVLYLIMIAGSIPTYLLFKQNYFPQGLPTILDTFLITVLPFIFYKITRILQGTQTKEKTYQIALFRKFNSGVSYGLRAGILPTLVPYGYVKVIIDQSLNEKLKDIPAPSSLLPPWSQVYTGENHIEMFSTTDITWKLRVSELIQKSEVAILDITHLSDALAWELNECLFWLNIPGETPKSNLAAIILICNINYLGTNLETIYSMLINKLAQQNNGQGTQLHALIPRPLTYVNFHMVPFFAWRIYHAFLQLSISPNIYSGLK